MNAQQSATLVAAVLAGETLAKEQAAQPEASPRNGSPSATLANLAEAGRKGREGAANRFKVTKGKAPKLDIAKLWLANAVTADGNPVRNQFAATLDAMRSALGLAKTEAVPEALFAELKKHSREDASRKAQSFHNFHTVGRIKQSERGALLKVGGFGLDRTTATRHLDLPTDEQIRAGRMTLASIKTSLAKMDERFLNASTIADREDIAERAQAAVSKSIKVSEELRKLGESAVSAAMPEAIGDWVEKREAARKASEEALAARRSAPKIGKPKADKPASKLGETGVPATTGTKETESEKRERLAKAKQAKKLKAEAEAEKAKASK